MKIQAVKYRNIIYLIAALEVYVHVFDGIMLLVVNWTLCTTDIILISYPKYC